MERYDLKSLPPNFRLCGLAIPILLVEEEEEDGVRLFKETDTILPLSPSPSASSRGLSQVKGRGEGSGMLPIIPRRKLLRVRLTFCGSIGSGESGGDVVGVV